MQPCEGSLMLTLMYADCGRWAGVCAGAEREAGRCYAAEAEEGCSGGCHCVGLEGLTVSEDSCGGADML